MLIKIKSELLLQLVLYLQIQILMLFVPKSLYIISPVDRAHIILLMLKLKSEQDEGKHSIDEIRKKFRKKMREEELQSIFAAIREKLIQQSSKEHALASKMEQKVPTIVQQPLPPNYYQYMSYAMRMVPVLDYPIYHHTPPPLPPPISPLLPQIDENIYFQKNGFVIYKVLLGSGTYAQVWQGKVRTTGQKIAAKQVKFLQENQRRCLKELQSQHVVRVMDIFTHFSKSFIILQFCQKNLRQELIACDFKIEMALKYFEQLVQGMDVLQSRNIIHRDLKFQNILVKDSKIKIADFGLAKCLGSQLQVESRRCGTPYTMAPEIYFSLSRMACYTIKSDIWSIGVILHEMLYQMHPFHGSSHNFKKEKRANVMKKYGILDKIIDECLVFNPSSRINWSQFKVLFNYYRQEKDYYFCPKQRPIITKLPLKDEKTVNEYEKPKKQACRKQETRLKQRNAKMFREKQESKDRREDRTPPRKIKYTTDKNIIDKDKFEHPIAQKRHLNDVRQLQAHKKIQKLQRKMVENEKYGGLGMVDFKEMQYRPFYNEIRPNKPIIQAPQRQQYSFRQCWQFSVISLSILIIVLFFLYLRFD